MSWIQVDLIKDNGHLYFIKYLDTTDGSASPDSRAQAAFVLAVICDNHQRGAIACAREELPAVCLRHLMACSVGRLRSRGWTLLAKWLALCLGKLCEDQAGVNTSASCSHSCSPASYINENQKG